MFFSCTNIICGQVFEDQVLGESDDSKTMFQTYGGYGIRRIRFRTMNMKMTVA